MKKLMSFLWKWLVVPLIGLVVILTALWSVCAIYLAKSPAYSIRIIAASVFILSNITVFLNTKRRWYFLVFFGSTFIAVIIWWSLIPPSNNRNWADQTSVLSYAAFSNNFVTVHNVRNFDYKSKKEFTTNYYTKTYNLNKLKKLYLVVSYWDNNRAIAHTMLDFEFENGDCLVLSVEVRREKGEEYSAFKGLFKMNEIIYILADERDVIRLRTNFENEKVYLYPLRFSDVKIRMLLVDILNKVNKLKEKPEFYNAITENCTVSLVNHFANISENKKKFYIEYLLNGFLDWRLYENGVIETKLPPKEAKQTYFISDIAKETGSDANFSKKIRAHLPGGTLLETNKTISSEQKIKTKSSDENWNTDFTSLNLSLGKLKCCYPDDMISGDFPPAGESPVIKSEKTWPDVSMNAKWTIDIKDWTPEEKSNALDSILMRACNPNFYKKDFPKTIESTKFTPPPEFKKEEENPNYNLLESLRGKTLNYEVVMNAGFGAGDYTIKTKIYIGASKDGNTFFYYDRPENISAHLEIREFTLAAHKSDNKIFVEINIFCRCKPSAFIRGTKMNRVEDDSKYFIMQMFNHSSSQE